MIWTASRGWSAILQAPTSLRAAVVRLIGMSQKLGKLDRSFSP